jgi:ABC-type multidrug transport system fused ATPase/permease subunit
MTNLEEYLNINERKKLPRSYWFNPFIRWFTILFSVFAVVYGVWMIFNGVYSDSPTIKKVLPFLIIFFASNSLLRNLFTLNRVLFAQQYLRLDYLLRKSVVIKWQNFRSIRMQTPRHKILRITYTDDEGRERSHEFSLAFPHILEILNAMIELCPQVELDDFMESIVIADRKKEAASTTE